MKERVRIKGNTYRREESRSIARVEPSKAKELLAEKDEHEETSSEGGR